MIGLPEPYSATNAVGMPLTPSLTLKPAFLSTPMSRADERCSSRPSSAKVQMSWLQATSSGRMESSWSVISFWIGVNGGGSAASTVPPSASKAIPQTAKERIAVMLVLSEPEDIQKRSFQARSKLR